MAQETATETVTETATEELEEEEKEQPDPNLVDVLENGTKIKRRVPRQRACNNSGKNNNICRGHLKRWYDFGVNLSQHLEGTVEVYRCERCQTLYLPNSEEVSRTGTLAF